MPRLTIGMATFNDFDGVYFTIQALRLEYRELFESGQIELLVVDQSNNPAHLAMSIGLCTSAGARHIQMGRPTGTSPSRNRVFSEAKGDYVMCVDSHVLFRRGAITDLLKFLDRGKTPHLYQGPMINDDLKGFTTHFNPEWRSEMYGTWGRAWRCKCAHFNFSCIQSYPLAPEVGYIPLSANAEAVYDKPPYGPLRISHCPNCKAEFPVMGWAGHEAVLLKWGAYSLGQNPADEPFEIQGHGLGVFSCWRDAWLKFNEDALGFGAEELNIHALYSQRGFRTICLPFLQWCHRFGRPNGTPYPVDRYQKVRNYVLWHNQLGKPLDDIHRHFVEARLMSPEVWKHLVADPVHNVSPPADGCGSCGQQQVPEFGSIEEACEKISKIPRDFNEHVMKLKSYADQCETVTELSIRRESAVALAASKAKMVISYNRENNDKLITRLKEMRPGFVTFLDPMSITRIGETDLLFLNDEHTGKRLLWQLQEFGPMVKHYIVLHNTQIFGTVGEDREAGLIFAMRAWMKTNRQWSVIFHDPNQYGLTVLSCHAEDKKQLPGKARQLANFTRALASHVMDGARKVTLEILESRLDVCTTCPQRRDNNCGACGCNIDDKASWLSSDCPLGYWPEIPISK